MERARELDPLSLTIGTSTGPAYYFIGFTGFTLVMPFLPLYIAELGTTDVGEIAMWTGLTLGATPSVTAISLPCAPCSAYLPVTARSPFPWRRSRCRASAWPARLAPCRPAIAWGRPLVR
jgi:hypothetical protein